MHELVAAVVDENVGVVAGVLGRTEQGAEIDLELLLLPLAFDGRTRDARRDGSRGNPGFGWASGR